MYSCDISQLTKFGHPEAQLQAVTALKRENLLYRKVRFHVF